MRARYGRDEQDGIGMSQQDEWPELSFSYYLDKIVKFCVEYLLSATNTSNQYTSTIRIQQVLQNVYIDDDTNVVFRYDSNKSPLFISTAVDFLEPSLFMSEHSLNYILNM